LYQKATTSLGMGISSILTDLVVLKDGESNIEVNKAGNVLTMRNITSGVVQELTGAPARLRRV
jgi:hypothetical protein